MDYDLLSNEEMRLTSGVRCGEPCCPPDVRLSRFVGIQNLVVQWKICYSRMIHRTK